MAEAPKYKFLPDDSVDISQTCPIIITEGKFEGIVYRYGKISFNELETGDLNINMDIEMITSPEGFDQQDKDFTTYVGDIFVDIIENQAKVCDSEDLEADVHEDPLDKP
jgi:hypothetical protein